MEYIFDLLQNREQTCFTEQINSLLKMYWFFWPFHRIERDGFRVLDRHFYCARLIECVGKIDRKSGLYQFVVYLDVFDYSSLSV